MENKSLLKSEVKRFWDEKSCGEVYAYGTSEREFYNSESRSRYELEPYIHKFARFKEGEKKDILEIGVGMGADHAEWAICSPKSLTGVDLTPRAIEHTKKRFDVLGLESDLREADAEHLPFDDSSFDLVYSWGVLHHSPDTYQAVNEVFRVLRPGGIARIMIYHKYSLTGYMLFLRNFFLKGQFVASLDYIYFNHLESPGTKAYSVHEAKNLFADFSNVDMKIQLCFGDLLEGEVGQRYRGRLLSVVKKIWPRKILKLLFKNHGLFLLVEVEK